MGTWWKDIAYGARGLWRTPTFTLTVLIVLALGIGANTAIFSVLNPLLFRALPFPHADELVVVVPYQQRTGQPRNFSYPDFLDTREQAKSFAALAALTEQSVALGGLPEPVRARAAFTTSSLFPVLGIKSAVGRTLLPADDVLDAPPVVVLSHGAWVTHYGGDPGVVGRAIAIEGKSFEVVGIMPLGFRLPADARGHETDVFLPLHTYSDAPALTQRGMQFLLAVGRLAPGVGVVQATAEGSVIAERLEKQFPDEGHTQVRLRIDPLRRWLTGEFRSVAMILLAAVGLVLLMACANVGNLVLVRSIARRREFATRLAMGASRGRLLRQLLTESLLLSLLAGGLGLGLSFWMTSKLSSLLPPTQTMDGSVDGAVLLFTFGATMLAGVLFGLAPALSSSKVDVHEALKEAGAQVSASGAQLRLKNALIASQIALAFALLSGAGLMIRSLGHLTVVHPGFEAPDLAMMRLPLPAWRYSDDQKRDFYLQLIDRVKGLPGVVSAGVGDPFPFFDGSSRTSLTLEGFPPPPPGDTVTSTMYEVSADYFTTMGIPILRGRTFSADERAKAIVINQTFAARYWPNDSPLGKRIIRDDVAHTIVGVVGDIHHGSLDRLPDLQFYVPFEYSRWLDMNLVVRAHGSPERLTAALRDLLRQADPQLPVPRLEAASDIIDMTTQSRRATTYLLEAFAVVALLLASIGLYGLVTYAVAQRRREFAIRVVLGAERGDIVRLVLQQGLSIVAIGLGSGLLLSFASAGLYREVLFGVAVTDPLDLRHHLPHPGRLGDGRHHRPRTPRHPRGSHGRAARRLKSGTGVARWWGGGRHGEASDLRGGDAGGGLQRVERSRAEGRVPGGLRR
jgi:putative ABC transport system permease protein